MLKEHHYKKPHRHATHIYLTPVLRQADVPGCLKRSSAYWRGRFLCRRDQIRFGFESQTGVFIPSNFATPRAHWRTVLKHGPRKNRTHLIRPPRYFSNYISSSPTPNWMLQTNEGYITCHQLSAFGTLVSVLHWAASTDQKTAFCTASTDLDTPIGRYKHLKIYFPNFHVPGLCACFCYGSRRPVSDQLQPEQ